MFMHFISLAKSSCFRAALDIYEADFWVELASSDLPAMIVPEYHLPTVVD